MTYLEMHKKSYELGLVYMENNDVCFKQNIEIVLNTGETIICDILEITDTCNDDEEDILEFKISSRKETSNWPFDSNTTFIENKDIKFIRLL